MPYKDYEQTKKRSREYYYKNKEERLKKIKKYYYDNWEKKQVQRAKWIMNNLEKFRKSQRDYRKKWRKVNQEKIKAHQLVRGAIKSKKLIKPTKCSGCLKDNCKIEAHHHKGYSKENYLDVIWLCPTCHKKHEKNKRVIKGS